MIWGRFWVHHEADRNSMNSMNFWISTELKFRNSFWHTIFVGYNFQWFNNSSRQSSKMMWKIFQVTLDGCHSLTSLSMFYLQQYCNNLTTISALATSVTWLPRWSKRDFFETWWLSCLDVARFYLIHFNNHFVLQKKLKHRWAWKIFYTWNHILNAQICTI